MVSISVGIFLLLDPFKLIQQNISVFLLILQYRNSFAEHGRLYGESFSVTDVSFITQRTRFSNFAVKTADMSASTIRFDLLT